MWVHVKQTFLLCKFLDVYFMGITSSPLVFLISSWSLASLSHLIFNSSYIQLIICLSHLTFVSATLCHLYLIFISSVTGVALVFVAFGSELL